FAGVNEAIIIASAGVAIPQSMTFLTAVLSVKIEAAEAIMMASLTPAKSVNIDDVCGQIKPGLSADFIVLDNDFDLVATYLDGEKRYEA
ncbi:amidohydrolase family protein, partial [Lactococcus lactis]